MLIQWLKKGGNVAIHGTFSLSILAVPFTFSQMPPTVPVPDGIPAIQLGGLIVIANSTSLSAKISARVAKEKGMSVIFLESVCNDPAVIAANVALKVSSGDPDYKNLPREEAERDFLRRIREYEAVYETITEPHLSYLRITDVGNEVTLSRINGYLQSRIAFYLMNLHVKPRNIFLSRVRGFLRGGSSTHVLI